MRVGYNVLPKPKIYGCNWHFLQKMVKLATFQYLENPELQYMEKWHYLSQTLS